MTRREARLVAATVAGTVLGLIFLLLVTAWLAGGSHAPPLWSQ